MAGGTECCRRNFSHTCLDSWTDADFEIFSAREEVESKSRRIIYVLFRSGGDDGVTRLVNVLILLVSECVCFEEKTSDIFTTGTESRQFVAADVRS